MNTILKNVLFLITGLLLCSDSLDAAARTGLRHRTNVHARVIDHHGEAFDDADGQIAREIARREFVDACAEDAEFKAAAKKAKDKETRKAARAVKRAQEAKTATVRGPENKEEKKEEDCPICLSALDDNVRATACMHTFHENCLNQALEARDPKCPLCNMLLQPDNYTARNPGEPIRRPIGADAGNLRQQRPDNPFMPFLEQLGNLDNPLPQENFGQQLRNLDNIFPINDHLAPPPRRIRIIRHRQEAARAARRAADVEDGPSYRQRCCESIMLCGLGSLMCCAGLFSCPRTPRDLHRR